MHIPEEGHEHLRDLLVGAVKIAGAVLGGQPEACAHLLGGAELQAVFQLLGQLLADAVRHLTHLHGVAGNVLSLEGCLDDRLVGMVLQNPDNQLVSSIVEEDVAFGPENLGIPSEEIRQRVDDALKAVGMYEYREHAPHLLSGGQKQRVAIAGVIAMAPRCIVLDEPTAMLDPIGRQEVLSAVHKLNREKGITVVLITHHMNEAEEADRVIVMDDGRIALDGTPKEVFTQVEPLRTMGLTVPDTVDLLDRLRKDGLDVPLDALTVDECAAAITAALAKN